MIGLRRRATRRAASRLWVERAVLGYLLEQPDGANIHALATALQVGPVPLACALARLHHDDTIRVVEPGGAAVYALTRPDDWSGT